MAVYQPVNSQEIFAVQRIALAQQALLRAARLEVGLFTLGLNECFDPNGDPVVVMTEEVAGNGDLLVTQAQNRNFLLGEGFHRMIRRSNTWTLFLRYQAQTERHYRRAVEDFERLKALREELPNEPILEAQPEPAEQDCDGETNPPPPQDPADGLLSEPMLDTARAARIRRENECPDPGHVPDPWEPGFAACDAMCRRDSRAEPPNPAAEAPDAGS